MCVYDDDCRNARTTRPRKWKLKEGPLWEPNRQIRRWRNRWSPCCCTMDGTNSRSCPSALGRRLPVRCKNRQPRTISPWTITRSSRIGTRAARRGCLAAKSAYGSSSYMRPKTWPVVSSHFLQFYPVNSRDRWALSAQIDLRILIIKYFNEISNCLESQ